MLAFLFVFSSAVWLGASGACMADDPAAPTAPAADAPPAPEAPEAVKEEPFDPKSMTAEESLRALVKSFADAKMGRVWEYFPPSYRKDMTEVTHLAIAVIDPEVYDQTFALVKRFVKVMKDKKALIFATNTAPNKEDLERAWDRWAGMLQMLIDSDLSTHAKAKKIDLAAFFEKTGSRLYADLFDPETIKATGPKGQLAFEQFQSILKAKISVLRDDGEKVLIRIEFPGRDPSDTEYRRVEGQWFPSNAADLWPGLIAKRKAEIEALGKAEQEQFKQTALPLLALVDRLLTNMENAKTPEEFEAALSPLWQLLGRGNEI